MFLFLRRGAWAAVDAPPAPVRTLAPHAREPTRTTEPWGISHNARDRARRHTPLLLPDLRGRGTPVPRAAGVAPRGKVAPRRMYRAPCRARGGPARPGAPAHGGRRGAAGSGNAVPPRDVGVFIQRGHPDNASPVRVEFEFDESPKTLSRAEVVGVEGTAPGGARRAGEIRTHAAAQRSDPYRHIGTRASSASVWYSDPNLPAPLLAKT